MLLDRYAAGELCDEDKDELNRMANENSVLRQLLQSMPRVGHRWSDGPWAVSDGWKAMTLRMATLGSRPIAHLISPEITNDSLVTEGVALTPPLGRRKDVPSYVPRFAAPEFAANNWRRWLSGVTIVGILVGIGLFARDPIDNFRHQRTAQSVAMSELTTTATQRTSFRLVDGTFVTLGPQTKLRIPSNFGEVRDVYLQGEAMFEVTAQSPKPFIVHTTHASVRVLGTMFDVRAHENLNRVEVAVVRGKVSLASPHSESPATIVSADYLGTMYPNGEARVDRVSLEPYTAWVDNRLVYRNTPLREVVADIARWYNVQVVFDRIATDRRRLIADWDPRSLTHVLHSLSLVLDARYENRNGQIIFFPREDPR